MVAYQVQDIPGTSDELPRCLGMGTRPPKKGLGPKWPWLPTKSRIYRGPRTSYLDALGWVRDPPRRGLGPKWPWLPTKSMMCRVPRTSYLDALGWVQDSTRRDW